jgi:hypothetical protein
MALSILFSIGKKYFGKISQQWWKESGKYFAKASSVRGWLVVL